MYCKKYKFSQLATIFFAPLCIDERIYAKYEWKRILAPRISTNIEIRFRLIISQKKL